MGIWATCSSCRCPFFCRGLDWVAFKDPCQRKPFYNSLEWSISHKDELVGPWVFCQELLQDLLYNSVLYCQTIFVLPICCFPSLFFHHPRLSCWQSCFVFSCCGNRVQGRSILCVSCAVPLQNSCPGAHWSARNLGSKEWRCDFTASRELVSVSPACLLQLGAQNHTALGW